MPITVKTFDELMTEFNTKLTALGSQITNRQEGGAYDLLIRVFCIMLQDAYQVLKDNFGQGFVSTAAGDFLDLHAAAVGLTRNAATKARKEFVLQRDNAAGVLQVAVGDIIKTPSLPNRGELNWVTLESDLPELAGYAGQFEDGEDSITLILEADEAGTQFNGMEALLGRENENVEMTVVSGFTGVDTITTNGKDLVPGTDAEIDADLRDRISARWSELAWGATRKSYINYAKQADPRIKDANAYKGTNSTDVKIVLSGPAGARDLSSQIGTKVDASDNFDSDYTDDGTAEGNARPLGTAVHEYIRARCPLTDFIILESVTEVPTDITLTIKTAEGYISDDVIDLVTTRLRALFTVENSVTDVNPLEVGEKLKFSEVTRILNETPGVADFNISAPTQDGITPTSSQALTLGTISVTEM